MSDPRRKLPSVSALLERDAVRALLERAPRSVVVDAIRSVIDAARIAGDASDESHWDAAITSALARAQQPSLRRVINATGVVLHTNLGRAPLAAAAVDAIRRIATGYTNLEYDLDRGARGSRYAHCVALLRELTGAEDAVVVNNNAAALVLALNTFASQRGALISRGELVEIGGSFRIPDIMERSGARLVEVGTTNRTHLADYENALADDVAVVLKVHRSNFSMEGFVAEVDGRALAQLAIARNLPFIHDLGSGLLIPLDHVGLSGEPTVADVVRAGATVVTLSGDKLLGGPQAGIVVGAATALQRLRENPLLRALRVDKLTLAALEATLLLYREPERAMREVPVLAMLSLPVEALRARADRLRRTLGASVTVETTDASVGGGAFPGATVPSVALSLPGATTLEQHLRLGEPAVIGRLAGERLLLDLRTVLHEEDEALASAVRAALAS
ncbi:MAG TPA: L-seryl-tRNA(Sec) selenium transferase [Gemmatimonadaceae bacterium]|nr:L-seryl-tRNA(Sec) selenium transferase [Gemmatimonadaceae bacterium]